MGVEMPVQVLEDFRFHLRDTVVIHLFRGTKRAQLRLERRRKHHRACFLALGKIGDGLHFQVERIEPGTAGGTVWARMLRRIREQGMKRIEQQRACAGFGTEFDQAAQIAEISDAIVALGADAVELGRETPHPSFAVESRAARSRQRVRR